MQASLTRLPKQPKGKFSGAVMIIGGGGREGGGGGKDEFGGGAGK